MKKVISLALACVLVFSSLCLPAFSATGRSKDYTIVSPYADVDWSTWNLYKSNFHTHTTASDANVDLNEMVMEYYKQGFDVLCITDHGVTGKAWNEQPTQLPLYLYQYIVGNKVTPLTDEEYEGITSGTYPVDGQPRGYGMTCVTGGNELNALTITKCHVNGIYLPPHAGDNYLGYENDHEGAVKLADEAGAYSFINHPGDWLHSNRDRSVVSDPENVHYFSDIILKYDSCRGMEIFNEKNSVTPYDRVLWDNVLMECLPYGKNVIAYSNSDAHSLDMVDSSFEIFVMPENTEENVREAVLNGVFFCTTRNLPADEDIGPEEGFNVRNQGLDYPEFTEVSVDGHTVTVKVRNCNTLNWVANGKVIAGSAVDESAEEAQFTLDLDTIEGAENFLYVRAQIYGKGGCTVTQALMLDDGSEPLKYEPDTSSSAKVDHFFYRLFSTRFAVLVQFIIDRIKNG